MHLGQTCSLRFLFLAGFRGFLVATTSCSMLIFQNHMIFHGICSHVSCQVAAWCSSAVLISLQSWKQPERKRIKVGMIVRWPTKSENHRVQSRNQMAECRHREDCGYHSDTGIMALTVSSKPFMVLYTVVHIKSEVAVSERPYTAAKKAFWWQAAGSNPVWL